MTPRITTPYSLGRQICGDERKKIQRIVQPRVNGVASLKSEEESNRQRAFSKPFIMD